MERFIIELFVRGVVLCLLTALALLLLRRAPAAYRHLMCVLALCGLLALPPTQRLLPPLLVLTAPASTAPKRMIVPAEEVGRLSVTNRKAEIPAAQEIPRVPVVQTNPASLAPHDTASLSNKSVPVRPAPRQERSLNLTTLLASIWLLGTVALLIRLLVALIRLRRLEVESRQVQLGGVPVRVSERVATPLTWGIFQSVILLPAALASGNPAVCETAVRHEQAHIARRDWLWNLLAEVVCALCWFQPGTWWVRRRMRTESERACDDLVLLSGIAGPDYAAHLLEIAKSAGRGEVAPAMAQSGGIKDRMTHILDTKKSRRVGRFGLALGIAAGCALLCLAALRVAARPAIAKPFTDRNSSAVRTSEAAMSSQPSELSADSGSPRMADLPFPTLPSETVNRTAPAAQPGGRMAVALPGSAHQLSLARTDAPPLPGPVIPLDRVVWGTAVDGLEPGFLLNSPGPPNERVPFNSKVSYQALVRNATSQEREFMVQCQNHDEMDIPYLIPSDNLVEALDAREIPAKYRATGTSSNLDGVFPAYVVRLAPGEAVVLPEGLELYVGDMEKQSFPRIEQIKEGMNWVVQPITIQTIRPADVKQAEAGGSKINVTIASRDGRAGQRAALLLPARNGGKRLYAKIQLEVGTLDAEAARNAGKTVWGKTDKGMQCGIRLLTDRRAYRVGDTLEAEILWRCVGNSRVNNVVPRRLDLYPVISDAKGHELLIDFGARFNLIPMSHTFEPGEIHSLGVSAIKLVPKGTPSPKSNAEPGQITLEPGVYKLSGFGGVSAAGAGNPKSGEIEFRVVGETAEPSKEEGVFWGEKASGFQLGARIVPDRSVFKVGDTIKFQTFGRNLSGKVADLTIGNDWKVNYTIQVQTLDGKPIYMERDARNEAKDLAGYLGGSIGNGATQEISEAVLKIARPRQIAGRVNYEERDAWVEAVSLKPGRYRVRIVGSGVFGRLNAEPASGWIPIEITSK